jgi:hypothetical protein
MIVTNVNFVCRIWGSHTGGYEEYYVVGYNAVYSVATCFQAGILLDLFHHEDEGDMFLRNIGRLSTDYAALYPRI